MLPLDATKMPTDSLYKLTAIGGIVLVVLGLYFVFQIDTQRHALHTEARVEAAALEREHEFLERFAKQLDDKAPTAISELELSERTVDFTRRVEANNLRIAEINRIAKLAQKDPAVHYIAFMIAFGTLLFISGTAAWFWRLQRHQDRLIWLQVQAAEKEAKRH